MPYRRTRLFPGGLPTPRPIAAVRPGIGSPAGDGNVRKGGAFGRIEPL